MESCIHVKEQTHERSFLLITLLLPVAKGMKEVENKRSNGYAMRGILHSEQPPIANISTKELRLNQEE